jgi:hypothetical protein
MKALLFLTGYVFLVFGWQKHIPNVDAKIAISNINNARPKTKTQLLTGHVWKYYELFNNYTKSGSTLVYKRGKRNNLFNFDADRYHFKADKTFSVDLYSPIATWKGTWEFINKETQIRFNFNDGSVSIANIIKLNEGLYIFYDAAADSYGKLIPQ